MSRSVESQRDQFPHRVAALRTAADWSQPAHLNTPTYSAEDRPVFYHPTEYTDRHHFSPEDFNPWADSPARPRLRWSPAAPEQPTLDLDLPSYFTARPGVGPDDIDAMVNGKWRSRTNKGSSPDGVYPVDREPQKLYRGLNLDLRHPDLQEVHRALWGPEFAHPVHFADESENPGLFPRPTHTPDPRGFANGDLGRKILDHIENWHPEEDQRGLGKHWSTASSTAAMFAGDHYGHSLPVALTAEWYGRGEDPYRTDAYGNFHGENEITMMPGAPLRITQVHIRHPETGKWHPVLGDGPQHRQAARDEEDEEPEEEAQCEDCGPGESPYWCEACDECALHGDHEEHCPTCGPNDSDWCQDCETCTIHGDHENHCPSCGPDDYDWCEDCQQCKNCDWHDPHCSLCGPNDSDWCENCESCKSCDGCNCDPDAEPLTLNTPLFKGWKERPQFYDGDRGEVYYFSPHEINPASGAQSRPHVPWRRRDPDEVDPALDLAVPNYSTGNETLPVDREPVTLYRGLTINMRDPDLGPLRRAVFGPEHESYYSGTPGTAQQHRDLVPPWKKKKHQEQGYQPGMFPGIFSDRELAGPAQHPDQLHKYLPLVLDHLENYTHEHGLGRHWSLDPYTADSFAEKHSGHHNKWISYHSNLKLPVRLTGGWMGQGEDPYRRDTMEDHAGEYEDENEITMIPGTRMPLKNVEIFHPGTGQWHSIMHTPEVRMARRR